MYENASVSTRISPKTYKSEVMANLCIELCTSITSFYYMYRKKQRGHGQEIQSYTIYKLLT